MLKTEQFNIYGKVPDGTETELDLAKAARKRYLKMKMRQALAHDIGDDPDTITDTVKVVLLCHGVATGTITDKNHVKRVNDYVYAMITGYGGVDSMLDTIEMDMLAVGRHVVAGYFTSKAAIDAAESVDAVRMIDLPPDPNV